MTPGRVLFMVAGLLVAGCGGSKGAQTPRTTEPTPPRVTPTTVPSGTAALQAEAGSALTGDIPDNQVFLTFSDRAAGYSMKYPEGWAQSGAGDRVTFRDKNNIARILVSAGPPPTVARVRAELRRLSAKVTQQPSSISLVGARAIKVVYTTESSPSSVTGKRVALAVDRYYLGHAARRAVVDLGTPQGVDNVDAYRLMIESFRWR